LVAIDSSAAKDSARTFLSRLVLNRTVSVQVNPSDIKRSKIVGVVHVQGKDVSRELLEAGAARYREPGAYSVSAYTACGYRIVERKAREAKKGLWQSASR
jgi:endonuclease YncB( thermonuclease family)